MGWSSTAVPRHHLTRLQLVLTPASVVAEVVLALLFGPPASSVTGGLISTPIACSKASREVSHYH